MHSPESHQLDLVFGALANPVRRSILDTVSAGESTVVEFAATRCRISKHMSRLNSATDST